MADPVRDFKSTDDGEWYTADGDFASVAGAEAVPQAIRIRVGMFLGECYLDESIGVDYIGVVLVKGADPLVVRAEIQTAIADTPDVINVIGAEVTIDGATREGAVSYEVDTVYSQQPFAATVEVP